MADSRNLSSVNQEQLDRALAMAERMEAREGMGDLWGPGLKREVRKTIQTLAVEVERLRAAATNLAVELHRATDVLLGRTTAAESQVALWRQKAANVQMGSLMTDAEYYDPETNPYGDPPELGMGI